MMMKIVLRGSKKFLTCSFTEAVLCWFVFILSSSNEANSSQQSTFFILNATSATIKLNVRTALLLYSLLKGGVWEGS